MVKISKKTAPWVAALSWYLCSYAREQGSSVVPMRSFVPGAVVPLLPNVLQAGELLLPVWPRRSWDHAACSTLLSHQSTAEPSRHTPGDGTDLQNFRLCAPLLVSACHSQPLSFSQAVVLEKFFLCSALHADADSLCVCVSPCLSLYFSLSLSISISLPTLHDQGSLPITAPSVLFSPQINSPQFLPSMMSFFCFLLCSFALSVLRSISWVFKIIWHLSSMFEGWGKLSPHPPTPPPS